MIEKYLTIPYVDSGRTMAGLDCWGLVLAVRAELGCAELPSFTDVVWDKPRANQAAFREAVQILQQVAVPSAGDVAAVMHGQLCLHTGVVIAVDGRLAVLDTNVGRLPRWQWLADFKAEYFQVSFYHDR